MCLKWIVSCSDNAIDKLISCVSTTIVKMLLFIACRASMKAIVNVGHDAILLLWVLGSFKECLTFMIA